MSSRSESPEALPPLLSASQSPYSKRYPQIAGGARISKERRDNEREKTSAVLRHADLRREQAKAEMYLKRHEKIIMATAYRSQDNSLWETRHANSPFRINLLAEEERIHEEHFIKQKEEEERRRMAERHKTQAKSDIIIKALTEFSDLEALRKEKRAILDEEHRLRALLALEKTNSTRKADRETAKRALHQRSFNKAEFRRQEFRAVLESAMEEETGAYRRKFGLMRHSPVSASFDATVL